jgi:chromosome segregation ATPase
MSAELEAQVKSLQDENNNLKSQLAQHQQGFDGMSAQLDAHREQLNESLVAGITARTNAIYFKRNSEKVAKQLEEAKKELASAKAELDGFKNKVV